jgi:hypothetical protein
LWLADFGQESNTDSNEGSMLLMPLPLMVYLAPEILRGEKYEKKKKKKYFKLFVDMLN